MLNELDSNPLVFQNLGGMTLNKDLDQGVNYEILSSKDKFLREASERQKHEVDTPASVLTDYDFNIDLLEGKREIKPEI